MGIPKNIYNDLKRTIFWQNWVDIGKFFPETGFCLKVARSCDIYGLYFAELRRSPDYALGFLKGEDCEGVALYKPKDSCETSNCKYFSQCEHFDGGAVLFETPKELVLAVGGTTFEDGHCKTYARIGSPEEVADDYRFIFELVGSPHHIGDILRGSELIYTANPHSLHLQIGEAARHAHKNLQLLMDALCCRT